MDSRKAGRNKLVDDLDAFVATHPAGNVVSNGASHPFQIGKSYVFRTVTMHLIGRVEGSVDKFLVLKDASWLAVSPRFMNFLAGSLEGAELEPVGVAFINVDQIVDAFPWIHRLPSAQL